MSALVRVKRKLNEEPSDAIILNCKRRKLLPNSSEETQLSSSVLKFAGTVQKDDNFLDHLKKQSKVDLDTLKENFKKHEINITQKLREETKASIKNSRYRVVNCFRSTNIDINDGQTDVEHCEITILEVENDLGDTPIVDVDAKDQQKYVYDLYYTNSDDLGDANIEEYVSIHPLTDTLVFGSFRDNGINEPESDDSEDSNDENNWRNDYPDESDLESINENDMIYALENVNIDEDLLSSDDGEEGFVYSIDSEAAGFEEDIDESDVHRYGERYARFKARHKAEVTTQINPDLYYGDIEDDNDYD